MYNEDQFIQLSALQHYLPAGRQASSVRRRLLICLRQGR